MKYLLNAFLVLVLFIVSCKKDTSSSPNVTPSTNTDTLLASYIEVDTTTLSKPDTMSKMEFTYDNQKRIILSHEISYYYQTSGKKANEYYRYFYYQNNDLLPYKEFDTVLTVNSLNSSQTVYHNYQNNVLIKDSILYNWRNSYATGVITDKFTYLSNKVIDSVLLKGNAPKLIPSVRITYPQILNYNIASSVDTSFYTNSIIVLNNSISYDNKRNPFAAINNGNYAQFKSYLNYPINVTDLIGKSQMKNNVTDGSSTSKEITQYSSTTYSENYKSTYEYNVNNLPTISRFIYTTNSTTNSATIYRKGYYYYTK